VNRRRVRVGTPSCEGLHCHVMAFEGQRAEDRSRWEEHHSPTCPNGHPTGILRAPFRSPAPSPEKWTDPIPWWAVIIGGSLAGLIIGSLADALDLGILVIPLVVVGSLVSLFGLARIYRGQR
jgi:hypothetical protein